MCLEIAFEELLFPYVPEAHGPTGKESRWRTRIPDSNDFTTSLLVINTCRFLMIPSRLWENYCSFNFLLWQQRISHSKSPIPNWYELNRKQFQIRHLNRLIVHKLATNVINHIWSKSRLTEIDILRLSEIQFDMLICEDQLTLIYWWQYKTKKSLH
jgi:hypothetical protein